MTEVSTLEHLNARPSVPRRVVVVGAGGFVGGAIVSQMRDSGIPVTALTRREVDLLTADAPTQLGRLLKPGDSIVFVSAIAPAKTVAQLQINLRMAEAICTVLDTIEPAHLVYISSDAIYADEANPVTERSSVAPSTLHGMMHAAREMMLRSVAHAPFAALRPTLIYGAGDPHSGYGPNRFRRQAAKGEPISIFGEGEERRDHIAIEDVAGLTELILRNRSRGALNAATGVSISFREIAEQVAAQHGGRVVSAPRPSPRPHLLHRFFDITECHKAFPLFAFTSISDGLARVHRQFATAS